MALDKVNLSESIALAWILNIFCQSDGELVISYGPKDWFLSLHPIGIDARIMVLVMNYQL